MSVEQSPTEVAALVATEAAIIEAAARELRLPHEGLAAQRLAGDASSRAFYRVTHPGGSVIAVRYPQPFSMGEGATARFTRWCEATPDGRLTFANDPLCHVELTTILAERGVPVPAILAVADREGLLFIEDAGDELLQAWARDAAAPQIEAAYERAVDIIATIRSATEAAMAAEAVAGSLAFDADKLDWELEFFRTNCFGYYLGDALGDELESALRAEFRELATALASRSKTLCHRDYHARNIIVRPGPPVREAVVVIDFQDARLGPITYDVVSLLEDPYTSVGPDLKRRLRERFTAGLRADGHWPGEEAFAQEYDMMTVQRLLKAVGTYTHQAAVRGKRDYVPYIAPALDEARAALDRLGSFTAIRTAIDRIPNESDRGTGPLSPTQT